MEPADEGFTLVEMLVVIIIIGILAAIAIPVFMSQRERAYDSVMKSDIHTLAEFEEAYLIKAGTYGSFSDLTAGDLGMRTSPLVTLTVVVDGGTGYCLRAEHANTTDTWYYDSRAGGFLAQGVPCPVTTTGTSSSIP